MKKYHKDVYMPKQNLEIALRMLNNMDTNKTRLSKHLLEHVNNKDAKHNYNALDVLKALKNAIVKKVEPFEITFNDYDFIEKFCIRTELDNANDICISINPYNNLLITAWINNKNDKHYTLDESIYEKNKKV